MTLQTTTSPPAIIEALGLEPHPEGGWYREAYRADLQLDRSALPDRFHGNRSACTGIYFLLERGTFSALHRIASDELWHFYGGDPLTVVSLDPAAPGAPPEELVLGPDLRAGQRPMGVVPQGRIFGAEVRAPGTWTLVGCTVAPGFDFADFAMPSRDALTAQFPAHKALVTRLTRA